MAREKRILATVYVDVETIPTQRQDVAQRIADKHKPEIQMVASDDPKDIKKILEAQRKAIEAGAEAYRKTSLDGTFGELACISWAIDDGPITSSYRALAGPETPVLSAFTFAMDDLAREVGDPTGILYVAHNAEFDKRFLTKRMTIHRLDGPPGLAERNVKSWDSQWRCTMSTWVDEWKGRISLADLALALSLPVGKDDLPGSEVYDAMLRGEHERVRQHCERDVELVRQVWARL